MAILDPRLLDLIETLVAARMNWLAFEIIDALEAGRTTPETDQTLAVTRQRVRTNDEPKLGIETKLVGEDPQPIVGDDQIDWAAQYVAARLESTLACLTQSLENLDAIVGEDAPEGVAAADDAGEVVVVLLDGDDQRKMGRAQVDAATTVLPVLRQSLEAWSVQARGSKPET